ncbi:hypothetical protein ACQZV8_09610 [Magnetococcales bacterium HHB-1]
MAEAQLKIIAGEDVFVACKMALSASPQTLFSSTCLAWTTDQEVAQQWAKECNADLKTRRQIKKVGRKIFRSPWHCFQRVGSFWISHRSRMAVVKKVLSGELKPDHQGLLHLPKSLSYLSLRGKVKIVHHKERLKIFFHLGKKLTSRNCGLIYCSDANPPSKYSPFGFVHNIRPLCQHWYRCELTPAFFSLTNEGRVHTAFAATIDRWLFKPRRKAAKATLK